MNKYVVVCNEGRMGRLTIYEIIIGEDSPKEETCICEIKGEMEYEKFYLGMSYKSEKEIETKIIRHGLKDNFIDNAQSLLIVDQEVKKVMDLEKFVDIEFVPIKIEKREYYILNIMNIIFDSLDMKKSVVMTFPDDFPNKKVRGKIGTIWKTVLYENKIRGHIFRIAEFPKGIFVDEYFRDLIKKNRFTGIDFHKIELS